MAAVPLVSHTQPRALAAPREIDDRRMFAPSAMDITDDKYAYADSHSLAGTETYPPSRAIDTKETDILADGDVADGETTEVYKESLARRRWVWLCWALTFWIPSFMLSGIGRMKRQDVRQAWREKLAINMIIWFICACTIFVIAILGPLICPTQHVYSTSELAAKSYNNDPNNALVAVRGEVFDLSQLATYHVRAVSVVPNKMVMQYGGLDATTLFPVQVSALCSGTTGSLSPWVTLDTTNTTDVFSKYHDFRAFTNDSRPDWYTEQMMVMRSRFRKGFMGYTKKDIKSMAQTRQIAIYRDKVYDMTTYKRQNGGGLRAPNGTQFSAQDVADQQFMSPAVLQLFTTNAGQDITDLFDGLASDIGQNVVNWQRDCLRNLFILGEVDTRDSPQCQFSTYILLVLSIIMVTIIGFKFLAALHFGSSRAPENHDKFVICQVPCYTEGEESLRRTIDSLVKTKYDDKRKLLMVVCDGNIKGFGNEKPTPAIVLDILGVDPTAADPEPLSFQSLGEGAKQHNMGKVYAGLYECSGHVVPYIVIVKVGKPAEKNRPGNRGKRDSQMCIMHFLNKIHFNAPMNPLELEMYHQIKNVIGVNPSFYEYLFMVDADTTVHELSLNRLVSAMMHDKKIIGVCGETSIANAKQSIVTMSQVYEYFISHHLAKAFESLFGSITCLPGCFSMYRLRTPDTHKPLFVSNQIINDYSENRVDTLHLKNLLHLGEDRYLTTLVLKHFPTYKTKFVRDAHAQTVAPDAASVLLSQRRRWINSTVHNLAELVFLDQLCGFCCFSMRFVVFIDLLSTIIAPVTVAYIGYLLYLVIGKGGTIPILSIIMLAAIYGLQALIFIFRMRWDMIAWMIFYILAIPVFSFFLPLYSFWKMDDFSWGSTRLVVGEKGKKIVIHDEGKFDKSSIPLKSWNEYENELWDAQSNHSGDSYGAPGKQFDNRSLAGSGYGYGGGPGTYAGSAAGGRPGSMAGSGMGMGMGMGPGMGGMNTRPGSAYDGSAHQSRAGSMYGGSQAGYHNPYQQQQQKAMAMNMGNMGMGQMPMGMSPNMHVGHGMNLNMSPFASNPNLPHMGMMGMGMGMGGSQGDRGSMYQYQAGGGAGSGMGGSAHGGDGMGMGMGMGMAMAQGQGNNGSRFNSFYGANDTSPAPSSPAAQHRNLNLGPIALSGAGAGYAPLSGGDPSGSPDAQAPTTGSAGKGASAFLPPTEQDWAPLDMGEAGISDAQLEQSIRRICAGADLDTLTKKGVRRELEQEYAVGFDARKETITRIIEKVLNE